jgi:hypothetical protein
VESREGLQGGRGMRSKPSISPARRLVREPIDRWARRGPVDSESGTAQLVEIAGQVCDLDVLVAVISEREAVAAFRIMFPSGDQPGLVGADEECAIRSGDFRWRWRRLGPWCFHGPSFSLPRHRGLVHQSRPSSRSPRRRGRRSAVAERTARRGLRSEPARSEDGDGAPAIGRGRCA